MKLAALQGTIAAKYALDLGFKKLAIVHVNNDFGVNMVKEFSKAYTALGGTIQYGTATQTSCFLMLRAGQPNSIWPLVLYPTGWFEVVFQYLATRMPFDDIALRDEFRQRLNRLDGVEIPSSKLALRPNSLTEVLTRPGALDTLQEALAWFIDQATIPIE